MSGTKPYSSVEKSNSVESRTSSSFLSKIENFKESHEKIRKHMESLAIKYNIENFPEKLQEQYLKLKNNARFSKISEYLNLIDAWVETFKSSNFSLDKLDKFQTDISLLVLALKENLEHNNEGVETWLELMVNKDSIVQTAERADEAIMSRSKQEQDVLFNEIRMNNRNFHAIA